MNLGLNGLQFFLRDTYVAIIHENFLITASRTGVIAAQRLEVLFLDFDASFLGDFSCSHSYKVSTLIDHACRCLEQSGLDWNPILLNQQQFLIHKHEYGYGGSSQKDIGRQFVAVFFSNGSHADEAYVVSEHLHAEDLDLEDIGSFFEGVESFHIVSELFAGLDLGQYGLVDVGQGEDRDDACLQGEFEGFDHGYYCGISKRSNDLYAQKQSRFRGILYINTDGHKGNFGLSHLISNILYCLVHNYF